MERTPVIFLFHLQLALGGGGAEICIDIGLAFDLEGEMSAMLGPIMEIQSGGSGYFAAGLEAAGEPMSLELLNLSWRRFGNVSAVMGKARVDEDFPKERLPEVAKDILTRSAFWFKSGWGEPAWEMIEVSDSLSPGPLAVTTATVAWGYANSQMGEDKPKETAWIDAMIERASLDKAAGEPVQRTGPLRM